MDCSVFLVITLSLTTLVTGIFGFNCYNCVQIKSELSIFDDIITDKVHSLLPDNFTDIVKNNNCIDLTSSTPLVSCKTACFSLTPSLDLTQYTGPTGPIVGEELDLDLILKSLESAEISIRGCADRFFSSYLKVDMSTVSGNISSTDGCLNIPDSKIFEISFAGNICYCTTEKCNSKPVGRKPPQSLPLATGRIYNKFNCYNCKSFTEFPQLNLPYDKNCSGVPSSNRIIQCRTHCFTMAIGANTTNYNGPTDLFLGGTINETILTWVTRLGNNTYAARGCMDNLWSYMLGNITSVGTERSCFYIDGSLYGAYGMVKICVCNQDNCNIQRPSLQRDAIGNGAETFHHRYLSTIFAMLIIGLTVRYGSSHIII